MSITCKEQEYTSPGPNQDWQTMVKTNNEKWSYMLDNNLFTDIALKVGTETETETIHCHRIILAMHSPVLDTMFSTRWGQENTSEVSLLDIDSDVCRIILKFLYTETFEIPNPSLDTCLSILRFASQYIIPSLSERSIDWLVKTDGILNDDSVLQIYEHAVLYSDKELEKVTLNLICSKTLSIFNSSSFPLMSQANLCRLLNVNDLTIKEFDLFEAACRWAEAECCRVEQDVTPENLRMVLKGGFHLIRFPAIPTDVFATRVVPTGLLSLEERVEVLTYLSMNEEQKQKIDTLHYFRTRPRSFTYTLKRFEGVGDTTFDYSKNWRNLVFQVNRPIKMTSLGFYGPGGEEGNFASTYTLKLRISHVGSTESILFLEETVNIESNQEIFHFPLPTSIEITPDVDYNIAFILLGPKTWMGNEIRDELSLRSEHHGDITFKFREAQYKNNRYQIPEICFTASR